MYGKKVKVTKFDKDLLKWVLLYAVAGVAVYLVVYYLFNHSSPINY